MGTEDERVAIFECWFKKALNFHFRHDLITTTLIAISIILGYFRLQINQLFQISSRRRAVPGRA